MFLCGRQVLLILGIGMLSACSESFEDMNKREFKENLVKAEQGNAESMSRLAYAYSMGYGTEKNISAAAGWWEKCAALDNLECKTSLAILYREGDSAAGIQADKVRARALFEEVVARGRGFEFNLADMYRKGEGGPVDYERAAPLYRKTIADYKGDMSFGMVSESVRFLSEMGMSR